MLFRSIRRRTVWKEAVEEIVEVEFQDRESGGVDLRPSMYLVNKRDSTRIAAEHHATASRQLTRKPVDYVDLVDTDGGSAANTPTEPERFAFASAAHRELLFASVEELRAFVESRRETWSVEKTGRWSLHDYVLQRRRERDPEWLAFLGMDCGLGWSDKCDQREQMSSASGASEC